MKQRISIFPIHIISLFRNRKVSGLYGSRGYVQGSAFPVVESPIHSKDPFAAAGEFIFKDSQRFICIGGFSASKNIDRTVAVFRPGVYSEVRFGYDDHTAYSLRGKTVKTLIDHCYLCRLCSLQHDALNSLLIVEHLPIAVIELYKELNSQNSTCFRFFCHVNGMSKVT